MHDYNIIPNNVRNSLNIARHTFNPDELFENLHTILHEESDDNEAEEVEHFKYEQQLDKSFLSRSSVIGLGFGLMSPVLGMCTSMAIGLKNGGPLTIIPGFIISGICIWFCSLSLGEIVSKFPMEIHVGSAMLAPESIKLAASWYTGWLMLIGNWTMSTSITFAGAQLTISLILMTNKDLISETHLIWYTVIVFYLVVTIVGVINLKFARFIEIINKVCVIWIIYAIIFIDILLLIFHRGKYRSLKYALFHFDNSLSGYSNAFISFLIGFQQSNFTLQGFSMLPALADEVNAPEKDIPRAMSTSVLISAFSGVIFLIPIMIILPDVENLFNENNYNILPIVNIFVKSTDSMIVSFFLVLMILGNLFFSGIGSITTSSRAVYSFSRDHAIPRHDLWTFVKPESQSKVPVNSVLLSMAISYILGLLALFSTAAFNAFIGAAVLCLCSGTCIPLILVLFRRRRVLKNAPVKIRYKLGWGINIISILWLLLSMFSVCMPISVPVTVRSMNYAIMVYILCLICITGLYFKWGKYNFNLPLADEMRGTDNVEFSYIPENIEVDSSKKGDDDNEENDGETVDGTTLDNSKIDVPINDGNPFIETASNVLN
ncbi:similar to Saccharomyces cerevisiae YKL174C TPO5 Protein involved in excretion of putrescine and spermidine [Maudiozyma saulgeensis]|uniref:Similar to Saccharomyces cerevisiae YKL174C TPO5 Protein involved in excretion of putrescine and spermidine n=1 Tax=Maudiozyma saulgeensis TaxID=1789683 RepID=A0A1X7R120_9SACH|nr:similar to Saccharomyces cerevisiae YKL174C TPO5 Protein involved in excretion of putrescine and spermidine [Kazachstania saulgeensis]